MRESWQRSKASSPRQHWTKNIKRPHHWFFFPILIFFLFFFSTRFVVHISKFQVDDVSHRAEYYIFFSRVSWWTTWIETWKTLAHADNERESRLLRCVIEYSMEFICWWDWFRRNHVMVIMKRVIVGSRVRRTLKSHKYLCDFSVEIFIEIFSSFYRSFALRALSTHFFSRENHGTTRKMKYRWKVDGKFYRNFPKQKNKKRALCNAKLVRSPARVRSLC